MQLRRFVGAGRVLVDLRRHRSWLLRSPSGSPNRSMSTRFSPPSRLRSTRAPAPRPLPALAANSGSPGQICLPMMTILSHSPAGAWSRVCRELLRGLQEGVLVAPDEVDLEQLHAQIAPLGLALERDAHEIGGLIVQAVGHVEIGFGQRIALIEIYRALARHRVLGRDGRSSPVSPKRPVSAVKSGTGCWPDSSTTMDSLPRLLRIAVSLRGRLVHVRDMGLVQHRSRDRSSSRRSCSCACARRRTRAQRRSRASTPPAPASCPRSNRATSRRRPVSRRRASSTTGCAGGGVGAADRLGRRGGVAGAALGRRRRRRRRRSSAAAAQPWCSRAAAPGAPERPAAGSWRPACRRPCAAAPRARRCECRSGAWTRRAGPRDP